MHFLTVLLTIVEVVVCLLIIGLVLIQRSKGEGLSAAISGGMGEAIFGANVGNVVTRTTVVLGIVFLVNTIGLTLLMTNARSRGTGSVMDDLAKPPVNRESSGMPGSGPGVVPAPVLPSVPSAAAPVAPAPVAPVAPAPAAP
ncbi:MAG: preprotein translocase subunit SecG [Kiritimatiellia bacterium]